MTFKTTDARYAELEALIIEQHPWNKPEVTAVELVRGSADVPAMDQGRRPTPSARLPSRASRSATAGVDRYRTISARRRLDPRPGSHRADARRQDRRHASGSLRPARPRPACKYAVASQVRYRALSRAWVSSNPARTRSSTGTARSGRRSSVQHRPAMMSISAASTQNTQSGSGRSSWACKASRARFSARSASCGSRSGRVHPRFTLEQQRIHFRCRRRPGNFA